MSRALGTGNASPIFQSYPGRPKPTQSFRILKSGRHGSMNIRKIIQRRVRQQGKGANASGDVNAVLSANDPRRGPG